MFGFASKFLLNQKWKVGFSAKGHGGFLQTAFLPISSAVAEDAGNQSFTVNYLINSCNLSLESAISASKKLTLHTPEKPNSVLTLLRLHGFSDSLITKLIKSYPRVIAMDPEKTLLPKLQFFQSIGASNGDLAKIISSNPVVLGHSLENHLIPWYDFLKAVVFDDRKVIVTLKRSSRILLHNVETNFAPNIALLRQLGMPESTIKLAVTCHVAVVLLNHQKFSKILKDSIDMGIDPGKLKIVQAMGVLSRMSKTTLEHKKKIYKSWGWSEDDTCHVLRKYPPCMNLSAEKINGIMDLCVNQMGWSSLAVARCPVVLSYSLENRISPRCSVIKVLQLKGLIRRGLSISSFVCVTENNFFDRFMKKYQEHFSELLSVYQRK